jgi:hypothetical protein
VQSRILIPSNGRMQFLPLNWWPEGTTGATSYPGCGGREGDGLVRGGRQPVARHQSDALRTPTPSAMFGRTTFG